MRVARFKKAYASFHADLTGTEGAAAGVHAETARETASNAQELAAAGQRAVDRYRGEVPHLPRDPGGAETETVACTSWLHKFRCT